MIRPIVDFFYMETQHAKKNAACSPIFAFLLLFFLGIATRQAHLYVFLLQLYSIEIISTISHLYFCKFQNHFPFLNIENYFYNWFLEAHSFENLMLTQKHKGVSNLQTLRHFVAKTIGQNWKQFKTAAKKVKRYIYQVVYLGIQYMICPCAEHTHTICILQTTSTKMIRS